MLTNNQRAFLSMIAFSEGTKDLGEDGYNILVGSTPNNPKTFDFYNDHPRVKMWIDRIGKYSTAAGRYQIKANIFDFYKNKLGLLDFGPDSQDKITLQLIKECHALEDIEEGRFEDAIEKCRSRWASFPKAGYKNQREQKMPVLVKACIEYGGITY